MGTLHLAVNVLFSFQGYARGLAAYSAGLLLFFFFLTLAPHDYIIYCQAWGLSGRTSPCGECAFLISGLHLGTGCLLGWSSAFLLLWTLAPRDCVIYC